MIVPPRLTRAALTFLLFGTVAALLPSQDSAALANNGCFTGTPLGTGKFAVSPSISSIANSYTLTSPATTYNYYYQSPSSSSYAPVTSGVTTALTVTAGKVGINSATYTAPAISSVTTSIFKLNKVPILNKFGAITGYENGSVTIRSTYLDTNTQTTYIATAAASNP